MDKKVEREKIIYLGAILSVEDYINLDNKTINSIEKIKKEWNI